MCYAVAKTLSLHVKIVMLCLHLLIIGKITLLTPATRRIINISVDCNEQEGNRIRLPNNSRVIACPHRFGRFTKHRNAEL